MTLAEMLAGVKRILGEVAGGAVPRQEEIDTYVALCDEAIAEQASLETRFDDEVGRSLNQVADLTAMQKALTKIAAIAGQTDPSASRASLLAEILTIANGQL